jgi:hypothetical protein
MAGAPIAAIGSSSPRRMSAGPSIFFTSSAVSVAQNAVIRSGRRAGPPTRPAAGNALREREKNVWTSKASVLNGQPWLDNRPPGSPINVDLHPILGRRFSGHQNPRFRCMSLAANEVQNILLALTSVPRPLLAILPKRSPLSYNRNAWRWFRKFVGELI